MALNRSRRAVFDENETRSIRAVYLLAISALEQTHHVDQKAARHLANAVFDAYVTSGWPDTSMSALELEDMAVRSIELLLKSSSRDLVPQTLAARFS